MKTHEARTIECPLSDCDRLFSRLSFLFLHLERSTCSSHEQVNELAFESDDSYDFVTSIDDSKPFNCPSCDKTFNCFSGLYQHVEDTPDCSYLLRSGGNLEDLANYMKYKLELYN